MSKAYNGVKLSYIQAVMEMLGFNFKWINLIMICITTVSYAALVNGQPGEIVQPTSGLR